MGAGPGESGAPPSAVRTFVMKKIIRKFSAVLFALGFLAAIAAAAPTDQDQVIVPNTTVTKAPSPGSSSTGAFTTVAVVLLAAAGGWLLWRGRSGGLASLSRTPRQLVIEETRSLGNRQFVVVAAYRDKKFLLGVCPGRIDFLAPLTDSTPAAEKVHL